MRPRQPSSPSSLTPPPRSTRSASNASMLALALAVALAPGPPPYGPRMMNAMVSQLPPLPMDSLGPPGATVLMLALVGGGLRLRRAVTDDDEPGAALWDSCGLNDGPEDALFALASPMLAFEFWALRSNAERARPKPVGVASPYCDFAGEAAPAEERDGDGEADEASAARKRRGLIFVGFAGG